MRTRSDEDRDRTIEVPLAIAEAASEVASIARTVAEGGNPRVAGDAIAGAELAAAVTRVGAELVEINLGGTTDPRLDRVHAAVAAAR